LVRAGTLALAALALVTLVVPFAKRPADRAVPSSVFNDYFAARGQGISICGGCSCGTRAEQLQCEADQRAAYERANPPRGQIEGVCYAAQYRWEQDPATRQQVQRLRTPIYSKVRYTETQVDGFRTVGAAWSEFVAANYKVDYPDGDGWNWTYTCAALSSPRYSEEQNWARAQAQTTYQRVFMPTYGVADTPEERAAEAKAQAERDAREAEQKRIAEAKAAEEARLRAAAEAARRQQVNAIAQQIGPGKTAAAERLHELNQQAAQFRPKSAQPTPAATPTPASTPRQCTQRQGTQPASFTADTREKAEAGVLRSRGVPGGSESIVSSSVSGASCTQRNQLHMKPPPVGNCLSCITEQQAINMFGYVPGKGYPPAKTEWVCKATVTYVAERCGSGPSKVSAQ
jgi:hypothetical protein